MKIESASLASQLDVVSNDQCQAARLCMRKLRELGYRRIGLATALDDESRLQDNFSSGVLVEQAELPESECVPTLLFNRADISTGRARGGRIGSRRIRSMRVISNWHELITLRPHEREGLGIAATDLCVSHKTSPSPPRRANRSPCHMAGMVQNHRLVGMRAMEQLSIFVKTYHRGAPENPSATYVPGYWRDGPTMSRKFAVSNPSSASLGCDAAYFVSA